MKNTINNQTKSQATTQMAPQMADRTTDRIQCTTKSRMGSIMKKQLKLLLHLFFPCHCVVCGGRLAESEKVICTRCNMHLPRTDYHRIKGNPVERMFLGKIPLERATSYFFYRKGSLFRRIIHQFKYGGQKELGEVMGRFMAADLQAYGFFEGIDVIVPIPLHPRKRKSRGYNQSEWIARGISCVSGIPVDAFSVVRDKNTETQTRKPGCQRWKNVRGSFRLRHPEAFVGKHVLIVDDVLTTGATTISCADAFRGVEGIRISILTLAKAVA